MSTPQRGDRGGGRGGRGRGDSNRGGSSTRGDFSGGRGGAPRGGGHNDRGGPSFRGDRGGGSFRGDRGGSFRGDRGGFQGDRGRGGGGAGRVGRGGFQLPIHSGPSFPNNSIFLEGNVPQPDKEVQALEDARVKNTAGKIIERFPGRPGHGTKGIPIVLRANYLHLKTAFETGKQEVPLYRYAVSTVGGEKLSKPKMRLLVTNLIRDPMFADCQLATDYSSIVVTTRKLDHNPADHERGKIEVSCSTLPALQGPDNLQAYVSPDSLCQGLRGVQH